MSTEHTKPPAQPSYRPGYHFTPEANWANDPNGLVFHNGVYHLFFQCHPHSMVWGPMHWGHATSVDLLHWQEHAIALAPDAKGMIFSGSAVLDVTNSAGLGQAGQAPLVALYTCRDRAAEERGAATYEDQHLAYSLDQGQTWVKYAHNPVLPNPGYTDFRDPKVFWHDPSQRWIMCLACGDHIAFYASTNLKAWTLQGHFGQGRGAHGGVWECPDLLELPLGNGKRWVLLVSLNPGGPQIGSATQYFVGDFDGATFRAEHTDVRWLDWGPDHYAGVSFSNTPGRCLLMGWMSNWRYADKVPTTPWRGGMTLPRELVLRQAVGQTWLCSPAAKEVDAAFEAAWPDPQATRLSRHNPDAPNFDALLASSGGRFRLRLTSGADQPWSLELSNAQGNTWRLHYHADTAQFELNRCEAGQVDFHPDFGARYLAPRLCQGPECALVLYADAGSMECLADGGMTSITSLVFPDGPWTRLRLQGAVTAEWGFFRAP